METKKYTKFINKPILKNSVEVNKELIIKVAKNARLHLTEEEVKEFVPQFKEILSAFSELDKLRTDNAKPSFQPIKIGNVLRDDLAKECVPKEELLKNAEHKKDSYFLGPRAL